MIKLVSCLLKVFFLGLVLVVVESQKVSNSTQEPFQLNEFLYGTFNSKSWNGTWVSDKEFLVKNQDHDVYKVNVEKLEAELYLEASIFEDYPGNTYTVTSDLKYALIRYNQKAVFRHSTTAQFTIYDIENNVYYDVANKLHLQIAQWAPVGTGLVYVLENDIYYVAQPKDAPNPQRITNDGVHGILYNGVPDWVYEEEVLGSGSALWFSPNGKRLVFASFDDKKVNEFHYFIYGEPGSIESQYPQLITLKYPKVGAANPYVSVKYVDLNNPHNITEIRNIIPIEEVSPDHVLQDITWATDVDVVAVSLNRVQNKAAITRCNVETLVCDANEKYIFSEPRGWLTVKSPLYNKDGSKFVLLHSETEPNNDTYKHLVLYSNGQKERLTHGERVVLAILGWDTARDLLYFTATVPNYHSNQHVYVLDTNTKEEVCLTCNFTTPEGLCKVGNAYFSKNYSYITKICNGPGPNIIHVGNTQNRSYFIWENNLDVRRKLSKKLKPIQKNLQIPLPGGFTAKVRLLLPPEFNESSSVKYPMIVNVYAGPNSNRISDSFSAGIENYFVTNRKYIYAYIDGRGSGRDSDNLMFSIYRNLGTLEVEDQITATKYLQDTYSFIDASKTGIWGWSYGGFSTIWALIKDRANVFKLGLAIAPVTSFIYYDTIYTERYMGLPTPEDNLKGYDNTDTTRQVEALRNKSLFLIHGNADDNVHYQQSMMLAKALERADIFFRQQSYPDENHSLRGVSPHLYHNIDQFFDSGFSSKFYKKWSLKKLKKT